MDHNIIIGLAIIALLSGIVLYAAANPPKQVFEKGTAVIRSLIK